VKELKHIHRHYVGLVSDLFWHL